MGLPPWASWGPRGRKGHRCRCLLPISVPPAVLLSRMLPHRAPPWGVWEVGGGTGIPVRGMGRDGGGGTGIPVRGGPPLALLLGPVSQPQVVGH